MVAEACERLDLVTDTYLSVGTAVQHAAPELLGAAGCDPGPGAGARRGQRARAGGCLLGRAAFTCFRAKVAGTASCRLPRGWTDDETAMRLLREAGVLVHPGYFYDFAEEDLLVLSLIGETQSFAEGVGGLAALAGGD